MHITTSFFDIISKMSNAVKYTYILLKTFSKNSPNQVCNFVLIAHSSAVILYNLFDHSSSQ